MYIIVIVISLPLVLLLEPFLNKKINFTRMKPLLDQFQGCYKYKYRCFAAYYMIVDNYCKSIQQLSLPVFTNLYKCDIGCYSDNIKTL